MDVIWEYFMREDKLFLLHRNLNILVCICTNEEIHFLKYFIFLN